MGNSTAARDGGNSTAARDGAPCVEAAVGNATASCDEIFCFLAKRSARCFTSLSKASSLSLSLVDDMPESVTSGAGSRNGPRAASCLTAYSHVARAHTHRVPKCEQEHVVPTTFELRGLSCERHLRPVAGGTGEMQASGLLHYVWQCHRRNYNDHARRWIQIYV